MTPKQLLLAACRRQPVPRVPVWLMRQAGRAMPDYRALRQKHSFLELCKTPALAARVSLEPVERLDVDAAIVFSDILIVGEAMGLHLSVEEPGGPRLHGLEVSEHGVAALEEFDPERRTGFVLETIRLLAHTLGEERAVIGFAAAPWTLACYLLASDASAAVARAVRRLLYAQPELLQALLAKIARVTARYLAAQIRAGATVVQLFDTWVGELSREHYDQFAGPATRMLLDALEPAQVPVILYARGANHLLPSLARLPVQVLSVDWRVDLAEARRVVNGQKALQGNVDPCALLGTPQTAARAARQAIERSGGVGHILNLGHGLDPETPLENVRAFIQAAQQFALPV